MRALVFSGILALAALSAQADVLTFSGNACSSSSDGSGASVACGGSDVTINQSYGDTAQVDVTYDDGNHATNSLLFWFADYNDLLNVAYSPGNDATSFGRILLLPKIAGETVQLLSFNLGGWNHAVTRTSSVRVIDAVTSAILQDYGTPTIGSGVPPNDLSSLFNSTAQSKNGLVIEWQNSAYNVGIDNVTFRVFNDAGAVPEPSTYALIGLGLAGLAGLRRRR
jgi:hypothetical protein